jgi:integrase
VSGNRFGGYSQGTLRQLLVRQIERNPARHHSVRLPRTEREVPTPPSDKHVLAILEHMPNECRLAFAFMEQTGARLGEPVQWTWATSISTRRAYSCGTRS